MAIGIGNSMVFDTQSVAASCTPYDILIAHISGGNRITFTQRCPSCETEIYASIDGGAYSLITTLAPGVTTYDHTGLDGVDVDYKLRSKNDQTVLNAPDTLVVNVTSTGFTITWNDNNTEADHIEIWENIAGAGYALQTTVLTGVQTYDQVIYDSVVNVKVRAKEGTLPVYSAYSSVVTQTAPAGYDTDAALLFGRMTTAGETPTDARKTIINDAFVLGKTKAFWAKMDAIWLFAAHGENSSLLQWLSSSYNCTKGSTPTFTIDRGWTTDATKYLHTNWIPSTNGVHYTRNSAGMGFYVRGASNAITWNMGASTSTTLYAVLNQQNGASGVSSLFNGTTQLNAPANTTAGLIVTTRNSSSAVSNYKNTTRGDSGTNNSVGVPDVEVYIGGYNKLGTLTSPKAGEYAFAFVGGGLTDQDLTDITAVFVTGYLTSVGAAI